MYVHVSIRSWTNHSRPLTPHTVELMAQGGLVPDLVLTFVFAGRETKTSLCSHTGDSSTKISTPKVLTTTASERIRNNLKSLRTFP